MPAWSGPMVADLVRGTLVGLGLEAIDLGLATTPTVEMAVPGEGADAGIILTASHNPKQWNALKLLNAKGEFISAAEGAEVPRIAEGDGYGFAEVDDLGSVRTDDTWTEKAHRRHPRPGPSGRGGDPSQELPRGGGCSEQRRGSRRAAVAGRPWA